MDECSIRTIFKSLKLVKSKSRLYNRWQNPNPSNIGPCPFLFYGYMVTQCKQSSKSCTHQHCWLRDVRTVGLYIARSGLWYWFLVLTFLIRSVVPIFTTKYSGPVWIIKSVPKWTEPNIWYWFQYQSVSSTVQYRYWFLVESGHHHCWPFQLK